MRRSSRGASLPLAVARSLFRPATYRRHFRRPAGAYPMRTKRLNPTSRGGASRSREHDFAFGAGRNYPLFWGARPGESATWINAAVDGDQLGARRVRVTRAARGSVGSLEIAKP